jgi:hypothetical protein
VAIRYGPAHSVYIFAMSWRLESRRAKVLQHVEWRAGTKHVAWWDDLNSSRAVMARRARRVSFQPGLKMASRLLIRSTRSNTKGMFLAGNRSRQQRRPSSSGTQEENAARRRFSGDEAQKILRKAIRKSDAGTG